MGNLTFYCGLPYSLPIYISSSLFILDIKLKLRCHFNYCYWGVQINLQILNCTYSVASLLFVDLSAYRSQTPLNSKLHLTLYY